MDDDMHNGGGFVSFAVSVNKARCGALYGEVGAFESGYAFAAVDAIGEETRHERQGVERRGVFNDGEVEVTVVYAGTRGDETIITVLVGIGDADDESLGGERGGAVTDMVGFRTVAEECGAGGLDVSRKTAPCELVEAMAYLGVETNTHRIKKRDAVRSASVDRANTSIEQRAKSAFARSGDAEVAAKAVAGAAGNQAESGFGAHESGGDFVQRAVAADGDDELAAFGNRLTSEFGGVTRPFGEDELGLRDVFTDEGTGASE